MASTSPQHQLRTVSRRAQALLQEYIASKAGESSSRAASPTSSTISNSTARSTTSTTETPWPKSIRFTFYALCAAAVPYSIGTAIAMSPRLREYLIDDDVDTLNDRIVRWVRRNWGELDYLPPIDRPLVNHVAPGYREEWQDDNWLSLLKFFGFNTVTKGQEAADASYSSEEIPPMSLEYEPPTKVREEQAWLSKYLSPKYNPCGIKTLISVIPSENYAYDHISFQNIECNLPSYSSLSYMRSFFSALNPLDLNNAFSGNQWKKLQTGIERISGTGRFRLALDFQDSNSKEDPTDAAPNDHGLSMYFEEERIAKSSCTQSAARSLLHNTSIHSSWAYFPAASSAVTTKRVRNDEQVHDFRMEQLKFQITSLEKELNDSSSLRNRDDMYEELQLAKKELKSLKPSWWRKILG